MITVAIIEDDAGTRQQLCRIINDAEGFELSGVYSNEEALDRISKKPPRVALMDFGSETKEGITRLRRIRQSVPEVQILIFTREDKVQTIFSALKAGACGYILKHTPTEQLLGSLRDVSSGGAAMSSFIARKLVEYLQDGLPSGPELSSLSQRQNEIMDLASRGYHNKEIAQQLGISTETVRVHLRHIYERLEVNSRSQAVVKYMNRLN
jgi:DNA-binding NarL/FixJ family response regulator